MSSTNVSVADFDVAGGVLEGVLRGVAALQRVDGWR